MDRARPRPTAAPERGERHLVGPVPPLARSAAGLGLAAAAVLVVGLFLPYADVGGVSVRIPALAAVAGLVWPLALAAAAGSVLAGRLPRLGLAAIGVTGALGVGLLVTEAYQLTAAGSHRAVEVFAGRRLVTPELSAGPGVWALLAAYLLLVLALAATLAAWPRTAMEDTGGFDPLRPRALVASTVTALVAALAVVAPVHTAPDDVVVDELSGFRTTLEQPADAALPERLGLDLAGGSLLALALVVTALLAATLRPRLATVGGYAALAAYTLGAFVVATAEALVYDDLLLGPGGWLYGVVGLLFSGCAVWALRARAVPPTPVAAAAAGIRSPDPAP